MAYYHLLGFFQWRPPHNPKNDAYCAQVHGRPAAFRASFTSINLCLHSSPLSPSVPFSNSPKRTPKAHLFQNRIWILSLQRALRGSRG